jgi:hypothetical protein
MTKKQIHVPLHGKLLLILHNIKQNRLFEKKNEHILKQVKR